MKYQLGNIIGSGSFGSVYELINNNNPSGKVIKFVQPTGFGIDNYIEHYVLLQLDHVNLMKAIEIVLGENMLIKIIQLKAICDLNYFLSINPSDENKYKIMTDVISGISYLNSKNILHGDIKPDNILIFEKFSKISDFGLSRIVYKEEMETDRNLFTLLYRPPEINNKKFMLKSDIWALGCTLYEIYYRKKFFELSKNIKYYHIPSKKENEEKNFKFNNLIWKMIEIDILKRADINDVRNFFNLESIKINDFISISDIKDNFKNFGIRSKNCERIFFKKCLHIPYNYNNVEKYKRIEINLCNKHKFKIENLIK